MTDPLMMTSPELVAEVLRLRAIEADAKAAWRHCKGVVVTTEWDNPTRISLSAAVSWLVALAEDRKVQLATARRDALEEAAVIAEWGKDPLDSAATIRTLKNKP